jgi:hypothetical protein
MMPSPSAWISSNHGGSVIDMTAVSSKGWGSGSSSRGMSNTAGSVKRTPRTSD